jgi:hypothetical protein
MGEYTSAVALATRLLEKKGRLVTLLRKPTQTVSNVAKPWRVDKTSYTRLPLKGVFLDAPLEGLRGGKNPGDERWCILAAKTAAGVTVLEPSLAELIEDGTKTYSIEAVTRLQPGDTAIAYSVKVTQWQDT